MKESVLAFIVLLLAQQQPQTLRGRIEGTVLREGTTEPVSGAKVTVTRVNASTGATLPTAGTITTYLINASPNVTLPNAPPPGGAPAAPPQPLPIPSVTTDRSGKFVVPDLEDGAYRVVVTLNGYVKQEYGQRAFTGQGTTLTLARGEVLKDLVVRITRAGNVNGRVTDDTGQPAPGVPLQLIKVTYNQAGLRTFQQAGQARTNDRGEYRLYWITPGRYYLAAGTPPGPPSGTGPGGGPTPNDTSDTYVFMYYPGTTDLTRATPVEVKAGSELAMDFLAARQQLYKISGRIVGAGNTAGPSAVGISLAFQTMTGGSAFFQMSQTYDAATGNFEMRNIVPGSYALQANAGTATARTPVEVVNGDVTNLILTLSGGVNIAGKVQVEGGGPMPSAPVRVQLRPFVKGVSHFVGFSPAGQANAADGTFGIERVLAGEYRATVQPGAGHYVKELRFDRSDALNSPIELAESASPPLIEVLLSKNVAQIDGVVTDDKGQSVQGVQAVLIPERNRERTELFKSATTDQAGRFNMRDVAPGDYKLFAWEALDNFGYFDPELLRRSDALGKAVRVDESARLNVDIRVIPESSR
jgi:5-hydroxyisourate hydrolase-like protein (transthyretin family)